MEAAAGGGQGGVDAGGRERGHPEPPRQAHVDAGLPARRPAIAPRAAQRAHQGVAAADPRRRLRRRGRRGPVLCPN